MVRTVKRLSCVALCLAIVLGFSGCSGNTEMTEANITSTVEAATAALQEFDAEALSRYVDSPTLSYILKFAEKHEQFATLGKAIFKNLEIDIDSIDLEAETVTVNVRNKELGLVANTFTTKLLSEHKAFELLTLLDDEGFLDYSLGELVKNIDNASMRESSVKVTLKVSKGKKNLVLGFDDDAENAVSGGALKAIKAITKGI